MYFIIIGDGGFDISKFKVGRQDCSADGVEDDDNEEFPSNNLENVEQVQGFFEREFGFNVRQSVAIMGAHTLGMVLCF